MRTSWTNFKEAIKAAGLMPRHCDFGHYQILDGKRLVNCWPDSKRGFVFQADGQKSRVGTIAEAIQLAGPPKAKPPKEDSPPWEKSADRHVGLIRRFWRWIW